MKKILFLIILSLATLHAGERPYFNTFAGLNFVENPKSDEVEFEISKGFVVGTSIGMRLYKYFRAEGEVSYRENSFSNLCVFGEKLPLSGNVRTLSFMANGLIDIPIMDPISFFAGGGLGYQVERSNFESAQFQINNTVYYLKSKTRDNSFAYQAIGGLSLQLNRKFTLSFEYRFLSGPSLLNNHSANLALRAPF